MEINNKYGYIYKTTNMINGKIYIGKKTSSVFIEDYYGTGSKIKKAITEFGIENFKVELLEWCSTKDILSRQESYWIEKLNSRDSNIGYNLKQGITANTDNSESYKTIGVQINSKMYRELLNMAVECGGNISTTIRFIILDYLKRYKNFKN